MDLPFTRIQHIGIPVSDLERSEVFYQSLGFENVMASGFQHNGRPGRVAMMKKGEIILEIYQMPEPELSEIRSRKNGHIDHVAFDVVDIDTVFSTLKTAGYKIFEDAPVFLPFWAKGCKYFNIEGPDGERLEFNEIL